MAAIEGQPPILCGDSAGAALALATAEHERVPITSLLLTNPNVDLTLTLFDHGATEGPDADLSRQAFQSWTRTWERRGDFTTSASQLPATFIAAGHRDALLPEARALAKVLETTGQRVQLAECDTGHGFLTDASVSEDVVLRAKAFLGL